jgi:hypothetical protein
VVAGTRRGVCCLRRAAGARFHPYTDSPKQKTAMRVAAVQMCEVIARRFGTAKFARRRNTRFKTCANRRTPIKKNGNQLSLLHHVNSLPPDRGYVPPSGFKARQRDGRTTTKR